MSSTSTPMRVLSNSVVTNLLINLSKKDVLSLAQSMSTAFTINTSDSNESSYQPPRQVVTRPPNGQTTLFMPATTPEAVSFKLVGVPPPGARPDPETGYNPLLRGLVAICDREGRCKGLLNSEETTAFRTSLGAMILYQHRRCTKNILMFGAGKQALWHLWLAVTMREEEEEEEEEADIETITIVNRSLSSAEKLRDRIREMGQVTGKGKGEIISRIEFHVAQPDDPKKREFVERADVIFCTTPSNQPVFPAEWLLQSSGSDKTRYISAIGSYKPEMVEIDPELIRSYSQKKQQQQQQQQQGSSDRYPDSVIVLDHLEGCVVEAGEITQSGIPHDTVYELGHILAEDPKDEENIAGLQKTLADGNVIYKSVGAGFMDLVIGDKLLEMAAAKGVGVCVEDF